MQRDPRTEIENIRMRLTTARKYVEEAIHTCDNVLQNLPKPVPRELSEGEQTEVN